MRAYVDTSALAKLLVTEGHSAAFRNWLHLHQPAMGSSELLVAELRRVAIRRDVDPVRADALLPDVDLLGLDSALIAEAGVLLPAPGEILGTLDALHLATALRAAGGTERVAARRGRFDVLLTYDDQFARTAAHHGFTVVSPRD